MCAPVTSIVVIYAALCVDLVARAGPQGSMAEVWAALSIAVIIMGVLEVLIGFWAVGYPGRSIVLLVIWVGATALAKGFTHIVRGFALHGVKKELAAA